LANGAGKVALAACLALIGLVFLSIAAEGQLAARIFGLAVAVVVAALTVRAVRAALVLTSDAVVVRNLLATRIVPFADVRSFGIVSSGNVTGIAVCLAVTDKEGKVIKASGTATYSKSKAERLLAMATAVRSANSPAIGHPDAR
jgi:hypothetical protein